MGDLADREISLAIARLKGRQREIFEQTGLSEQIGRDRFFPTVRASVEALRSRA